MSGVQSPGITRLAHRQREQQQRQRPRRGGDGEHRPGRHRPPRTVRRDQIERVEEGGAEGEQIAGEMGGRQFVAAAEQQSRAQPGERQRQRLHRPRQGAQRDEAVEHEQEARHVAEQGRVGEPGAQDRFVPQHQIDRRRTARRARPRRPAIRTSVPRRSRGQLLASNWTPAFAGADATANRRAAAGPARTARRRTRSARHRPAAPSRARRRGRDWRRSAPERRSAQGAGLVHFVLQPYLRRRAA